MHKWESDQLRSDDDNREEPERAEPRIWSGESRTPDWFVSLVLPSTIPHSVSGSKVTPY